MVVLWVYLLFSLPTALLIVIGPSAGSEQFWGNHLLHNFCSTQRHSRLKVNRWNIVNSGTMNRYVVIPGGTVWSSKH